jgi:homoserine O-acetyltransferase/O-succinyltransferase
MHLKIMQIVRVVVAAIVLLIAAHAQETSNSGAQQFAILGDLKLQNGKVIRDCTIGYRTFGHRNSDSSNVVLFPTWADGRTSDLVDLIGPGKLVDSSKYFVIAVDALGNGVSSSPSNSQAQPRMQFPRYAIRDMVESQHQLLTHVLHINHLHAVIGISMGGMQTFQWTVAYPGFLYNAISLVGSPRLAPYDLLVLQTRIDAIEQNPVWKDGDYTQQPVPREADEIAQLALTTPEHYNRENTREKFFAALKEPVSSGFDTNDRIRQEQAMMDLDVSATFDGSMERAAAAVKADMLIIVSAHDHMVNPGPALEFAKLKHARTLVLENDCGHLGPGCDMPKVSAAVAEVLGK